MLAMRNMFRGVCHRQQMVVDKLTELTQEDSLEWVFELQRLLLSVD